MKRLSINNIVFSLALLLITLIFAQEEENVIIEVKSEVDTSVITIGDQVKYSIIIDREKELRIIRPGEGLNLGAFGIKDYTFHEPVESDGRLFERFDFTITVFDTGRYTIPPFPIAYFLDDSSSQYRIIKAAPIEIVVNSVLSGESAKELKDIKLPHWIDFDYIFWGVLAAVLILLATASWFGWKFYKRRKERGYIFSPPPAPRPVHEIALENLDKLFKGNLLEQNKFKQFFSELTEILRIYIEGRFDIKALEETSHEILLNIELRLEQKELLPLLSRLLTLSDLVKFAKHLPGQEEIGFAKESALEFVHQSKLIFMEEELSEEEMGRETKAVTEPEVAGHIEGKSEV